MSNLKKLPTRLLHRLSANEDLCISLVRCVSLESLPMSDLPTTLKFFSIYNCPQLDLVLPELDEEIQTGHYSCAPLQNLTLHNGCDHLNFFPLGLFPKLKILSLKKCINLESLWIPEGVHQDYLTSLSYLELYMCPKLESFPKAGLPTPNLTYFSVSYCKSLKSLPQGMHHLFPSLQYLQVGDCPELESFPEGGLPSNLMSLMVRDCTKLTARRMEWGLQTLPNMKTFVIMGGHQDVVVESSFPEEGLLPSSLTSLRIHSFPNLKYLNRRGLQHLSSLEKLYIRDCPKLQCLPQYGLPNSLSLLDIFGCPPLQQWCQREKGWPKIAHIPNIVIDEQLIS